MRYDLTTKNGKIYARESALNWKDNKPIMDYYFMSLKYMIGNIPRKVISLWKNTIRPDMTEQQGISDFA